MIKTSQGKLRLLALASVASLLLSHSLVARAETTPSPVVASEIDTAVALTTTGATDASTNPGFPSPDTYDFSLIHYTDTQYIAKCVAHRLIPSRRDTCAKAYQAKMDWIINNRFTRKIAYVSHTGDVVDSYWGAFPEISKPEFEFVSRMQDHLDALGIPNGVIPGNHDNVTGTNHDLFNTYFGPLRYTHASTNAQPYYGGPWREGDNQNHTDYFTVGDYDFLVVALGYEVTDEEVAWANEQIAANPRHNVIITTHAYLTPGKNADGTGAGLSHDGATVREKIVKTNPNVFLVLSGHEDGVARNLLTGAAGQPVIELMADYQTYQAPGQVSGVTGFLRALQFNLKDQTMRVDTYSPSLNTFNSRQYDKHHRYDGTQDSFTLPVKLIKK